MGSVQQPDTKKTTGLFRQDALQAVHRNTWLGKVELDTPLPYRVIVFSAAALLVFCLGIAASFSINEHVTVPGQLALKQSLLLSRATADGIIEHISVQPGDLVTAGQVIATLSPDQRLSPPASEDAMPHLVSRKAQALEHVEQLTSTLHKHQQRVAASAILDTDYLRRLSELSDAAQQLKNIELAISKAAAAATQTHVLPESTGNAIVSPVNGTVAAVKYKEGHWIEKDSVLLSIIAHNAELEAAIAIPNNKIALVKPGQSVNIKLDTFPYQRYGVLPGKVNSIELTDQSTQNTASPSSSNAYLASITLASQRLQSSHASHPLLPGMTFKAEILTNTQSILDWLFADSTLR
ncbi:MAG: HlyD family efflux transporter periplasmic adaptor subunit [Pseudomonas sp.]